MPEKKFSDQEVVSAIEKAGFVTVNSLKDLLGINYRTAENYLEELEKLGNVEVTVSANGRYQRRVWKVKGEIVAEDERGRPGDSASVPGKEGT